MLFFWCFLLGVLAQPSPWLQAALAQKNGHRRVLLLYADTRANPHLLAQTTALAAGRVAMAERDLDVLIVCEPALSGPDRTYLHKKMGLQRAPPAFAGWLIGKDGGLKKRLTRPIAPVRLFGLIDAMPMRQAERCSQRP